MNIIKYVLILKALLLLSIISFAQKGIISTYKADAIFVSFHHITTGKTLGEPVLMGKEVIIKYNLSFESLTISYTDPKSEERTTTYLSFVRYDREQKGGIIMKDGHDNPLTVYNELLTNNKLSLWGHKLMDNKYMPIQVILDTKQVD
ncbi:hypothetical protein AHMF7605_06770 [Adhaeribacter arboris]|uniref:Uncharacterized protein n=1 Tax=Adhaeribacter arboris TaxID=2072846 RepID=A0A2T2YCM8_9BACT|nr:hypothetical protein [Adhaeribacter arboris]PSR53253.1 hypothetical protein AHMF7605_06770 [Adhaeribacter arboris]